LKTVGLIPARSGSKRVLNKNIRKLSGKPLIAYTIEAAIATKSLDKVIVSTDSHEIAEISRAYGAEVPFIRPNDISMDDTPDRPVMLHLVHWIETNMKYFFDYLVYLRPTTPFKRASFINNAIKTIANNDSLSSVRSVTKTEGVYHPYWMFQCNNNLLRPFIANVDISTYYQSQLLPPCYRLNGVVDVLRTNNIKSSEKNIYGKQIGFIEIEEKFSIDIDNEFDFSLCEFLMQKDLTTKNKEDCNNDI